MSVFSSVFRFTACVLELCPELYSPFAAAMDVKTNLEKTRSSGGQILGAVVFRSSGGHILSLGAVGAVRPELLD